MAYWECGSIAAGSVLGVGVNKDDALPRRCGGYPEFAHRGGRPDAAFLLRHYDDPHRRLTMPRSAISILACLYMSVMAS